MTKVKKSVRFNENPVSPRKPELDEVDEIYNQKKQDLKELESQRTFAEAFGERYVKQRIRRSRTSNDLQYPSLAASPIRDIASRESKESDCDVIFKWEDYLAIKSDGVEAGRKC